MLQRYFCLYRVLDLLYFVLIYLIVSFFDEKNDKLEYVRVLLHSNVDYRDSPSRIAIED